MILFKVTSVSVPTIKHGQALQQIVQHTMAQCNDSYCNHMIHYVGAHAQEFMDSVRQFHLNFTLLDTDKPCITINISSN